MFHSFDDLGENDFQFVKCVNRRVRTPDGVFTCDGDGIKTVYRSGCVYVRFTHSFSILKVYVIMDGYTTVYNVCYRIVQSVGCHPKNHYHIVHRK